MECPSRKADTAERLIAYVEGTLDPGAQFALERHLDSCQQCREIVAAQREVWAALDSWTPLAISPDFDERLYQRIAIDKPKTDFWHRFLGARWAWRPAMPVAAACAALVIVFLVQGPGTEPAQSRADSQAAVMAYGPQIEQVESALDDMEMLKQLSLPSIPSRQKL
jgi:anti-sigma factor RsiW